MIRKVLKIPVSCLLAPFLALLVSGCYESGQGTEGDGADDVDAEADSTDAPLESDAPDADAWDGTDEEPAPDWTACVAPTDCVLVSTGCCPPCGVPSLDDYEAINEDYALERFEEMCPDPIPCPACETEPNPELLATCIAGRCTGVDTGAEDFSACTDDDECVIRVPDCCECGADTSHHNLIALRYDGWAVLRPLVCDPMVDCPMCEPIYPVDAEPFCDEDGHCAVRIIPTP
jgi:hypothetical protein